MPATSARIYRERAGVYLVVIEASPLGVDGTVGENHRFFGMLMSRRGRPYMGSRRRLALVRVIGIMRSLSFFPFSFLCISFSLSTSLFLFQRRSCSRYARRFYYRLLNLPTATPRDTSEGAHFRFGKTQLIVPMILSGIAAYIREAI